MKFSEYQAATRDTAIYPEAGTGSEIALAYVALGLAGEAGEVANKVKKIIRDSGGVVTPEVVRDLLKEIGDFQWYAARLCDELEADGDEVLLMNLEKLQDRKGRGVLGGSGDTR